jgi:murein DD-endopeptidase MepM/ murein hydrolase activator NlpD
VDTYTVQPGETLSLIASVYGCTVEEIVAANNLPSADAIGAGQTLRIPTEATKTGPAVKLIPDSELVYGPAYIDFELERFVNRQGGYLTDYVDEVEGELRTGAEIVQLVAQRFSVGPRVLLALLELQSGWVTDPSPGGDTLVYPMGHVEGYQEGLYSQLSWAAARLNEGYYGWRRGDRKTVLLTNGLRVGIDPRLNAGTAGVQNCLAQLAAGWDAWTAMLGSKGFQGVYDDLFGNPFAYSVEPLIPGNLVQPELRLPWEAGETWYYTGGPHGGWGTGSGMAAVDFVPGEKMLGCAPSQEWVTAAAPGLVVRSENGEVIVDLDGDGFEQTGWVLLYLHIYYEGRVEEGTYVERGERIGHPSCEGGASQATHVHLARRYNGAWIPAGSGRCPLTLSGWTAHDGRMPYEGTMTRGAEERTACECWEDDINGLVSDNAAP